MFDPFSLKSWLIILSIAAAVGIVGWVTLYLVAQMMPLMFGYKGHMRKVRLMLFLGMFRGRTSVKPDSEGNYIGLRRVAAALRHGVPEASYEEFDRNKEFLMRVGDTSREPQKWYWEFFLIALSISEMFAYSLAVSPALGDVNIYQQYAAGIAIAFTMGYMFYKLMHTGGTSWYRRKRLRELFDDYRIDTRIDKGQFPNAQDIYPSHPQNDDDLPSNPNPKWKQAARRMTQSKGHFFYWAVAALLSFAVLSTAVRFSAFFIKEKEAVASSQSGERKGGFIQSTDEQRADKGADNQEANNERRFGQDLWEHSVFFIAITFVFVITQGVAIIIGHETAFASESSEKCAELLCGHYHWPSYVQFKNKFLNEADELLQEWIVKSDVGIDTKKHKTKMEQFYPEFIERSPPKQIEFDKESRSNNS